MRAQAAVHRWPWRSQKPGLPMAWGKGPSLPVLSRNGGTAPHLLAAAIWRRANAAYKPGFVASAGRFTSAQLEPAHSLIPHHQAFTARKQARLGAEVHCLTTSAEGQLPELNDQLEGSQSLDASEASMLGLDQDSSSLYLDLYSPALDTSPPASLATGTGTSDPTDGALPDEVMPVVDAGQPPVNQPPGSNDVQDAYPITAESEEGKPAESAASVHLRSQEVELAAALREETAELERQVQELAQHVNARTSVKVQASAALTALRESQRKVSLLEAMVLALRERLSDEETRNAALTSEVEAGRAELESVKREANARIEGLRSEVKAGQALLSEATSRNKELEKQVSELTRANEALQNKVVTLEQQVAAHTSAAAEAAAQAEQHIASIQASAAAEAARVAILQQCLSEREAQLKEAQDELARSRHAALQSTIRFAELHEERDELARVKNAMEQALAARQAELAAREADIRKSQMEMAASKEALQQALAALDHELRLARAEAKRNTDASKQALASLGEEYKKTEAELESATAAVEATQQALESKESKLSEQEAGVRKSSMDMAAITASLQQAVAAKSHELKLARAASKRNSEASKQALAALEAELNKVKAELDAAMADAAAAQQALEGKDLQLAGRDADARKAQADLVVAREALQQRLAARETELRLARSEMRRSNKASKEAIAALEAEYNETKGNLDKAVAAAEATQQALSVRESELAEARAELATGKSTLEQLNGMLSQKEQQLVHAEERALQAEQHIQAISAEHKESLSKAQALVQEREQQVAELKQQLNEAMVQAERESQAKIAELASVRGTLEAALSTARLEAHTSKQQLAQLQGEVESLIGSDLRSLLDAVVMQQPTHDTFTQSEELRALSRRQAQLSSEIAARHQALGQQAVDILPRLKGDVASKAQFLSARHAELCAALQQAEQRWEQDGSGMQAVTKLRKDATVTALELAGLLRNHMNADQRAKERTLRSELEDRAMEMQSVMSDMTKLRASGATKGLMQQQAPSSTKATLAGLLGQRLRELLQERDRSSNAQLQAALRAKEESLHQEFRSRETALHQQLEERDTKRLAELRAREERLAAHEKLVTSKNQSELSAMETKFKQQMESVKHELETKSKEGEQSLRQQLEAAKAAAAHATNDRQRLAAEVTLSATKARQQLADLATAREELAARSKQLSEMKQVYESGKAAAERKAASAAAEAALVAGQLQALQQALQDREVELTKLRQLEQQQQAAQKQLSTRPAAGLLPAPGNLAPDQSSDASQSSDDDEYGYDRDGSSAPGGPGAALSSPYSPTASAQGVSNVVSFRSPSRSPERVVVTQQVAQVGASRSSSQAVAAAGQLMDVQATPVAGAAVSSAPSVGPSTASWLIPESQIPGAIILNQPSAQAAASIPVQPAAAQRAAPATSPAAAQKSTAPVDGASAASTTARQTLSGVPAAPGAPIIPGTSSKGTTASNVVPLIKPPAITPSAVASETAAAPTTPDVPKPIRAVNATPSSSWGMQPGDGAPPANRAPMASAAPEQPAPPAARSVKATVQLALAGFSQPHEAKVDRGGEDAFFIDELESRCMGVADGVGSWAVDGVDVAAYAKAILEHCQAALNAPDGAASPKQAMARAQAHVDLPGSCTACVAILRPEDKLLEVANLGDSGLRIVRGKQVIAATAVQEHTFNMPYQMAHPDRLQDTDTADDAAVYKFPVEPGDVIIMATDGLWDNLWDEQVISIINQNLQGNQPRNAATAARIAQRLTEAAQAVGRDERAKTPWAVESAAASGSLLARMFPRGGKMDDVTSVVALVVDAQ